MCRTPAAWLGVCVWLCVCTGCSLRKPPKPEPLVPPLPLKPPPLGVVAVRLSRLLICAVLRLKIPSRHSSICRSSCSSSAVPELGTHAESWSLRAGWFQSAISSENTALRAGCLQPAIGSETNASALTATPSPRSDDSAGPNLVRMSGEAPAVAEPPGEAAQRLVASPGTFAEGMVRVCPAPPNTVELAVSPKGFHGDIGVSPP
mmetsp:Transcript_58075/g.189060  ORF Transcript_58075/g.189060 Transcript_58075/m.189060 type:complete len:204 (-) Transcript_58075:194-805(-)